MLKKPRLRQVIPFGLLATLVLLLALFFITPATAQTGCAVTKLTAGGTPRWLEGCGQVDPKGNPEAVARQVLAGQATALGLAADGSDLKLLGVSSTKHATYVRFNQVHKGVPVYLGQVLVQYNPAGRVQLINNHSLPKLAVDVTPTVAGADAEAAALAEVAGSGQLRAPLERELVIYGEGKAPQLAWHLILYTQESLGDWHVIVSAKTGAVLASWDQIFNDTGSGLGYDPNAVQESGNTGLGDNNDATSAALDAARVTLTLTDLLSSTNKLEGSYVNVTETASVSGCTLGGYTPGQADEPSRIYNYDRDDVRFEEVSVYAAITGIQNWFQTLGFTNVNNRSIPVNVHCIADDNSFYSSGDAALHFGDGGVDDAEDADITIHEYGHSVHDNQVPGWGPGGNTEQRAMGEGFGDFLAGMYYLNQGDTTFLTNYRYCIGEWDATGYNPVTGSGNGSGCLRWINGVNEGNGNDIGLYSGTPSEEHDDGRFWSAALTCIYEGLGDNLTARDQVMQLVLEHHFSLTPDNSDQAFDDAVNALLLADQNLFSSANQTLITNCAIGRNLIAQPQVATPAITAPTENATIPPDTLTTITWDTNGAPATAVYRIEYTRCDAPTFLDTVEDGLNGWTVSHSQGSVDWAQVTSNANSPTHSWFAAEQGTISDKYLVSPSIAITGSKELSFWHNYNLESTYDGGVVEISTDGSIWTDLGSRMTAHGYDDTIDTGYNSPIGGQPAFTGNSGGWVETQADLADFADQTVQLRFREADDESFAETGWWVDDIKIATPVSWTLLITTSAGASSYDWTTPSTAGIYCLRILGDAPDYQPSEFSPVRQVIIPKTVYLPLIDRL